MAGTVTATQQIQDRLLYQGQVYKIGGNVNFPLEKYFESCSKEKTRKWVELRLSKNTEGGRVSFNSTACWRGYVASWAIEADHLVLTAIQLKLNDEASESADVLRPVFGDKIKAGKLIAYWFDGHITVKERSETLFFEKGRLIRTQSF